MQRISVKIGFVPSYRFGFTPWCAKMRAQSLEAFAAAPGLQIVMPGESPDGKTPDAERGLTPHGAIHTLAEAEAAAAFFQRQGVDGLIICPLDFGDERSAAKVAEKLRVPVMLYATKEPDAPDQPSLERVSDSYCGNLSMASALYRRKIPFHWAGLFFPDEPAFAREVDDFVRAAAVVKGLRGAHVGQVGTRPDAFETVGFDEAALAAKFGQNVIHTDLANVVLDAQALPDDDPRVTATIDDISRCAATVTVGPDYLRTAAKLELALAAFWARNGLSAMAVQCWPTIQRMMGISTCATFGRLTGRGMLTACETDVLGAIAMRISFDSALGEIPPHFIDWTIRHRANPNRLLAWHCGNAPVCLAADPACTALRSRRDMKGSLPVQPGDASAGLFQFQIKPGAVTMCRLAEYDNQWKLLITPGEIVPSDQTLAGTWAWVEVKDHDRLYRTLVEEGFVHHASMIHGDQRRALMQACKFMDIRPVVAE